MCLNACIRLVDTIGLVPVIWAPDPTFGNPNDLIHIQPVEPVTPLPPGDIQLGPILIPTPFDGGDGMVPGIPAPIEGIMYPIPQWFYKPSDLGKKCCCEPAAELLSLDRHDRTGFSLFYITMDFDYKITGCYKEVSFLWWTCQRSGRDFGILPNCVNASPCTFRAAGLGPYATVLHFRYLSCEGGVWTLKHKKKGVLYRRNWNGLWQAKQT